jgi:hypothetical protein
LAHLPSFGPFYGGTSLLATLKEFLLCCEVAMTDIPDLPNGADGPHHEPPTVRFPKEWGPFLAFTAAITFAGFTYASMARSDTAAIVVGSLAVVALVIALIAHLWK